jgi:hypothetical protein
MFETSTFGQAVCLRYRVNFSSHMNVPEAILLLRLTQL